MQAYPNDSKNIAHPVHIGLTFSGLTFFSVFGKSGDFRGLSKEFKGPKEMSRGSKKYRHSVIIFS